MFSPRQVALRKLIKSILITGGGSGIGAAVASKLADYGCKVIVSGRRLGLLEAVADYSSNIVAVPADVADQHDQTTLAEALSKLPTPPALLHGAGYFQLGHLNTLTSEDWLRSFDTNVSARWALSMKCEPYLQSGRVLFVGSDSGSNVRVGGAAYSTAQSASETLRRALQAEWGNGGIAVSAFKPGLVDTDLVRDFLSMSEAEFPARSVFQSYIDRGEFSTPETIASFACWLLLKVKTERFKNTEWDVRDNSHHAKWLGVLKPDREPG